MTDVSAPVCKHCGEPIEENTPKEDVKAYGLAPWVHWTDDLDIDHNAEPEETA